MTNYIPCRSNACIVPMFGIEWNQWRATYANLKNGLKYKLPSCKCSN